MCQQCPTWGPTHPSMNSHSSQYRLSLPPNTCLEFTHFREDPWGIATRSIRVKLFSADSAVAVCNGQGNFEIRQIPGLRWKLSRSWLGFRCDTRHGNNKQEHWFRFVFPFVLLLFANKQRTPSKFFPMVTSAMPKNTNRKTEIFIFRHWPMPQGRKIINFGFQECTD